MTPSNGNSPTRKRLEGALADLRLIELRLNPVQGSFDTAHLREIHRRIFQDLPRYFPDVQPGIFREATPPGCDRIKVRGFATTHAALTVAYSHMDSTARARLDEVLNEASPARLANMRPAEAGRAIGDLYAQIDYIHPFEDGNSRSLREFTRQLASEAGFALEWERFGSSEVGRDRLYIARDLSVNALALPHIADADTKRAVVHSLDVFGRNPSLPVLTSHIVRPTRAVDFELRSPESALQRHPELQEAYDVLAAGQQYFASRFPDDLEAQARASIELRERVQVLLNQGEVQDLKTRAVIHAKTQDDVRIHSADDQENNQQKGPEQDLGR